MRARGELTPLRARGYLADMDPRPFESSRGGGPNRSSQNHKQQPPGTPVMTLHPATPERPVTDSFRAPVGASPDPLAGTGAGETRQAGTAWPRRPRHRDCRHGARAVQDLRRHPRLTA